MGLPPCGFWVGLAEELALVVPALGGATLQMGPLP